MYKDKWTQPWSMGPKSTLRFMRTLGPSSTALAQSSWSFLLMALLTSPFLGMIASPLSLVVGNGNSIQCTRVCHDEPITMVGQKFRIPFYVLPIHGANLVSGVQWLQTLGTFLSDLSIQFTCQSKPMELVGMNLTNSTHVSYSQICRYLFTNAIETMHSVSFLAIGSNYQSKPMALVGMNLTNSTHMSYSQICRYLFTNAVQAMHLVEKDDGTQ